jgi:hypothetical protein
MKDLLKLISIILLILLAIGGIGSCKYALWRAEHPGAATWTFFVPGVK